ncbi:MAG: hypothetical protein K2Y22_06630 [Candidatus Obscuribacterales bacterium]|nr:hypothetical protein [Candidatus Obscuribacterales bacterium]
MNAWQRIRKPALSTFILAHIIGLTAYCLPSSFARDALVSPLLPYIRFCGLDQSWTVFAPNPPKCSTYLSADVEFADGTSKEWEFPRVEKRTWWEKIPAERYRKWANDNIGDAEQAVAWPDAIRYIARLHNSQSNPPVFITLIKHEIDTPAPGNAQKREEHTSVIYTAKVNPKDLE